MIVKTAELTGAALDWAVAKADGCVLYKDITLNGAWRVWGRNPHPDSAQLLEEWSPSTNWSQGGPIIELEKIECYPNDPVMPKAIIVPSAEKHFYFRQYGPTILVAAMRAYVASKFGDEIEIPDDLM